ncbi:MAG TPA: sensor histidine kinase, partial [Symbiobacteriaceae bacterium]|nr:sensor histidine kinase [Symbiobacteriaceae bacterium]
AANIAGYVRDTGDRLLAAELNRYRQIYPEVIARDRRLQTTNLAVLASVALVALAFAWSFASGVTGPLRNLSRAAGRIAQGDLEGPPVSTAPMAGDEVQVLGSAFNHMQENLRRHVGELKEKAELERRLQAEELENLEMHSLLREAELRALQSQVNPHFLFNTLNMVAKMAFIEGSERTQSLLETVADLLRYSLRDLDRPVTLGQEVAQVERYMTIQGQRFRDRIRFVTQVDEESFATPIPCLTLQPLVENALIHGIGSREEGGVVELLVRRSLYQVEILVRDDGVGIDPLRVQKLNEGTAGAAGSGHTTGLGLQNVRRRLELFYGGEATLRIASSPGAGSTIIIRLPLTRGEAVADPRS